MTYQERVQARQMGHWFFVWAMLSMILAFAAFAAATSKFHHHHVVDPRLGFGFAILFFALCVVCMVGAAIQYRKARY